MEFYRQLLAVCQSGEREHLPQVIRQYGIASGHIWNQMKMTLPSILLKTIANLALFVFVKEARIVTRAFYY